MLKQLKLTNYRQHIDRTVEFKPGINAIRGAVEAGKTTIMEAWAYLFFGTKALAEALDDVVTYDTPVSKLKVEGTLTYLGVDYEAYRGKSGAEVRFGKEIITGQTEVTRFFESLFKCNAAMAGKLMIAEQVQLRGALEEGPKAAGEMIEYLADFDLLDRVVELIQTELSSGATTGVESRIALLATQAVDVEVTDTAPLEKAVVDAQAALAKDRTILKDKLADLESLDIVQASQILADEIRLSQVVSALGTKIENLKAQLAEPLPVAPEPGAIDAVRAKIESQKNLVVASKIHADLKAATGEELWDEPRAALDRAISINGQKIFDLEREQTTHQVILERLRNAQRTKDHDLQIELTKAEARVIKDSTCAFCQKDLSEVPEVVQISLDLDATIQKLKGERTNHHLASQKEIDAEQKKLDAVNAQMKELKEELGQLKEVAEVDDAFERVLERAADYITVDRSVVPARWTWTGPTAEAQDFAGDLAALVEQEHSAIAAAATRAGQIVALEDLKNSLATDQAARAALPLADAQETLDLAEEIKPKIALLRAEVEKAADAVHLAEGTLATARLANEQGVKASAAAKAQLALAQKELDDMLANNVLINKVRKARPVITNKLWNLTLGATSKYFTDVRGIPSVITRDGVFKCNGKPVAGLSGSAKDSLGLSIRVALVKTFIPTMPFLMLDEPAAACNAERETNMLGLLSTIGFDQVILITHSDLADAFADHMIQL